MLQIKDTIPCPGCQSILRVRVQVTSDGKAYEYYLCARCQDVARRAPSTGQWEVRGQPSQGIADVVATLQAIAAEEWQILATSRQPKPSRLPAIVSAPPRGR
jgi:hypothetical protein